MELAVNTFYKGMELDVHPLVLSQETLRDCLNGTYITENGNDFILLNDMGNRKIPYVKLPKNYIPIGMKEFGGIIYVAAYNPITKYGQIGSFPSPLLYIEENYNKNIDIEYGGFEDEEHTEKNSELDIRFLKELSKSYILTDNIYIGDSFSISEEDLADKKILPVLNDKIIPNRYMNNKYLLLFGIINNQNNFIDITKDLKSVGKWKPSISNSELDYYVFNTNSEIEETINYFKYKIAGPLALKLQYNIPSKVLYNIYGVRSLGRVVGRRKISDITLYIDCNIEFNSIYKIPDLNVSYEESSNSEYSNWFLFKYKNIDLKENYNHPTITYNNPYIYFDELKNLYIANIKGIVTFNTNVHVMHDLPTINYFIGTPSTYSPNNINPLYVEHLSQTGVLDINYLPIEDSIDILYWQFKTESGKTTLRYLFNAVGEFNYTITLIKVNDNNETITYTNTILNSPVEWEILNAEEGEAYKVIISTTFISTGKEETIDGYWILCTSLFNNYYETTSLRNFSKPLSTIEQSLLKNLLTIPITIKSNCTISLEDYEETSNKLEYAVGESSTFSLSSTFTGNLIKKYYIEHDINYTLPNDIQILTIVDTSKYPSYLRNKINEISSSGTLSNLGSPNIYYTVEKNGIDSPWSTGENIILAIDVTNNTSEEIENIENNIQYFGALTLEKFKLENNVLKGKIKLINNLHFISGKLNFKSGTKIIILKPINYAINKLINSDIYSFNTWYENSIYTTSITDPDDRSRRFESTKLNMLNVLNDCLTRSDIIDLINFIQSNYSIGGVPEAIPDSYRDNEYMLCFIKDKNGNWLKSILKRLETNHNNLNFNKIDFLSEYSRANNSMYCPLEVYENNKEIYGIATLDSENVKVKEYVLTFNNVKNNVKIEEDSLNLFSYNLNLLLLVEGLGTFDIYDDINSIPLSDNGYVYCFANTEGQNLVRTNNYDILDINNLNITTKYYNTLFEFSIPTNGNYINMKVKTPPSESVELTIKFCNANGITLPMGNNYLVTNSNIIYESTN